MTQGLIRLDKLKLALEKCTTVDEAKGIRDKAEAARVYAKSVGMKLDVLNACAELKLMAERRCGKILKTLPLHSGTKGQLKGKKHGKKRDDSGAAIVAAPESNGAVRLADLGLGDTKAKAEKRSKMWQAEASVEEQDFQRFLEECRAEGIEATTNGLLRVARGDDKEEKIKELKSVANRKAKKASGTFDVIVIDPPWQMEKIDRDCRQNQVAFDYPTMSEDELRELKVPCAKSCHVWVWTTHKFLPMALRLLETWRLKYVCTFVWHKPGGFQPIGLPQYNCEFALYARKGAPPFATTKKFMTAFAAPRGKHSEKPEKFYEMLRRVTAGRRLDMFNRREIKGFERWGNES